MRGCCKLVPSKKQASCNYIPVQNYMHPGLPKFRLAANFGPIHKMTIMKPGNFPLCLQLHIQVCFFHSLLSALQSTSIGAALRAREAAVVAGEGQCRTLVVHAGLLPAVLQKAAGDAGLDGAVVATPEKLLAALQQTVSGEPGLPVILIQIFLQEMFLCRPLNKHPPHQHLSALTARTHLDCPNHYAGALKDCATPGSRSCNRRSAARQTLSAADSLVWLRDYVQQPERLFCPGLQQVLTAFAVRRMVVGHNVMRNGRVNTKCGGALQLADVGMSRAYYSNLAVWTCDNDRPEALYQDEVVKLPLSTCCHPAGEEEQTQQ